jgi:uncharacterized protein with LGFP repeats
VNGQRGQLGKLVGRALVSLATTVVAAALLAPTVAASPIGDAEAAIMSAWEKAGGDTSVLGARKGDVYPVGDGFALDFDGGKMFYTTDSGAKYVYGPILDKYESLGGPAGSDLGFPTINEVPGLAGPDSRVATFSASDKPVIFWTPDHGAFVVRGALNAAWDQLGSSGGVLGAPIGDETYDGDVISQKFTGGAVSWNRKSNAFTTDPAVLGDQLKGLQVALDPTAAINMAWRAAGGANGPLGAKQGGQQPIGGDGIVQAFAGGKVFFSPATGASAVESDILAKYESLGGPVGSDLGFPIANETDGGIGPSSRICTFSAADKPVIFWTPDHGAFVVRGAMKAAWDKLRGPTGKLGAPVGDQAVDGDVISQKFTGGKIAWNRANNTFSTDPANLAPLLSGLQVSGQNQPSGSAMPPHAKKFTWHWWWLVAAVVVLLVLVMLALVVFGWLRRRHAGHEIAAYQHDHDVDVGYDADAHWPPHDAHFDAEQRYPPSDLEPADYLAREFGSAPEAGWTGGGGTDGGLAEEVPPAGAYGSGMRSESDEHLELEEEDPDAVDTTPTPVVTDAVFSEAASPDVAAEDGAYPDDVFSEGPSDVDDADADADADAAYPDAGYRDDVFSEGPPPGVAASDAAYPDDVFSEAAPPDVAYPDIVAPEVATADAAYPDDVFSEAAPPDVAYPDIVAPEVAAPDAVYRDPVFSEPDDPDAAGPDVAAPDAAYRDSAYRDPVVSESVPRDGAASDTVFPPAADSGGEGRTGRHAALDAVDALHGAPEAAPAPPMPLGPSPAARPTIHMPLDDPYQMPDGYPIKASARFGLYYTPESALYHDTLAEIWFASEDAAEASGFMRAD